MSSKNHVFQGSCNFMIGSSSLYVTTLKSLLASGIVVVEVSHHSTNFGGHRYSGGGDNNFSLSCDLAELRDQSGMWLY